MNRPKDTFLIMLLPQTLTAAIALTMFAVIAFRMEANTEGFVIFLFLLVRMDSTRERVLPPV